MLEFLMSAASGGIFGGIVGLFKKGIDLWHEQKQAAIDLETLKEKNRHESDMQDKQMAYMQEEAKNGLVLAQLNAAKEENIAWMGSVSSALASDRAAYATGDMAKNSSWFIAVDVFRGMIRPGLTIYLDVVLTAMAAWVFWKLTTLSPELLNDKEFIKATFIKLVDAIIFSAMAATNFWFMARMK